MKKGSSPNDKKIIELLKKNPNGLKRNEIKNKTGIPEARLTEALKRLDERNTIKKFQPYDSSKGKQIDYFRLSALENVADPVMLKELMDLYQKSKKNQTLISELQKEIEHICSISDVRDKTFIQFIADEAEKINEDTHILRRSLGLLARNLYRSIDTHEATIKDIFDYDEQELLSIVQKPLVALQNIIFDKKRTRGERIETLHTIREFDSNIKYDVSFKIMLLDDEIFENEIESLILEYATIDLNDCKKKLWSLLEKELEQTIKNKIVHRLECIRNQKINKPSTILRRPFGHSFTSQEVTVLKDIARKNMGTRIYTGKNYLVNQFDDSPLVRNLLLKTNKSKKDEKK